LFISCIYAIHDINNDAKTTTINIAIAAACYLALSIVMGLAKSVYSAMKYHLCAKLTILWAYSYVYTLFTAMTISITIYVFNSNANETFVAYVFMASILANIILMLLTTDSELSSSKVKINKCEHAPVIATSVVVFISSTIINIIMLTNNMSHERRINSSSDLNKYLYLIIIGSFAAILVANIVLLMIMLLLQYCCSNVDSRTSDIDSSVGVSVSVGRAKLDIEKV
jgi:hypothetical protein